MTTVHTSNNVPQSILDSVNGSRKNKGSNIDDVQDRFMTLLVTQMKNQDPLNPMDNAQVTSQMAQLSTVSGIDKLNDTLESLIGNVQASQSYQASSMIGHHVLVDGNTLSYNGEAGIFGVDLPVGADQLTVNIKDRAGATIRTMTLGAQATGTSPFNWDGYNNDGVKVNPGNYQVEISATVNGNRVVAKPLSYAQVVSVSNINGNVSLNLSNQGRVSTADVKEIF